MLLEIKMKELIVVAILFSVAGLIGYAFYADSVEMDKQHCERTNESRQTMVWISTYDAKGNITGGYPVFTTEWLYTCDDRARWR